jgi:hypothetical protein
MLGFYEIHIVYLYGENDGYNWEIQSRCKCVSANHDPGAQAATIRNRQYKTKQVTSMTVTQNTEHTVLFLC